MQKKVQKETKSIGYGLNQQETISKFCGNNTAVQLMESSADSTASSVIQRRTEAFKNIVGRDIQDNSWFFKTEWKKLQTKIDKYSKLENSNYDDRKGILDELIKLKETFVLEMGKKERLSVTDSARLDFCRTELSKKIGWESDELERMGGALKCSANEVSQEPELTKKVAVSGSDKEEWILFVSNTPIVNINNVKTGDALSGKVALSMEPDPNVCEDIKESHEKVKAEESEVAGEYFQDITPGYVIKKSFVKVNKVKLVDGYKYSRFSNPLFPQPPTVDDIKQGGLGDCYLLAAMLTVVQKDQNHFVNHMKDNGNGTVTVKLYQSGDNPLYVTVKKTVVTDSGKSVFGMNHWVAIYEKAYVAAGFTGSDTVISVPVKSYGMIESGNAGIALQHITGEKTEEFNIAQYMGNAGVTGDVYTHIKGCIESVEHTWTEVDGTKVGKEKLRELEQAILVGTNLVTNELEEVLKKAYVELMSVEKLLEENKTKAYAMGEAYGITEKELAPYINWAYGELLNFVKVNQLASGKLGYADYTQKEITLFEQMKGFIESGKKVIASTKAEIFNDPKEIEMRKGHSAGENMVKGLAGPHAYAVLDYAPKDDDFTGKTLSVKLRNPWGRIGRSYKIVGTKEVLDLAAGAKITSGSIERIEDESPEFWIDIAEVAAFFSKFTYNIPE